MELGERVAGCLLGGAVGDALGAGVEFLSWAEIRDELGPYGVTGLTGGARFTDDTQMTLFTAEGMIRARVRWRSKGICYPPGVVRHAYLRWLHTQGVPWGEAGAEFAAGRPRPDGWLVLEPVLHRRMAPGNTCLAALRAGGSGTVSRPANDSKGCGAVMRAAPVGFCYQTPAEAWDAACDIAAITHGHPDGIYPAGVLAVAIGLLAGGQPLREALASAAGHAPAGGATRRALARAMDLAAGGLPDPVTLNQQLGEGWIGEEALAIAACCALAAATPKAALLAAVNHSGDSDSTGSITGNLLGAAHGLAAIPEAWLAALDGADLVRSMASDLATELASPPPADDAAPAGWWDRYPGW